MEKFINYNALLSKLFEQWKNSYDEDDKKDSVKMVLCLNQMNL